MTAERAAKVLAEALHETCRAEWARLAGYGATGVTQHGADAHMHTAPTVAAALAARGYRIVPVELIEAAFTVLDKAAHSQRIEIADFDRLRAALATLGRCHAQGRRRHDPTDHDCRGGAPGDPYPL